MAAAQTKTNRQRASRQNHYSMVAQPTYLIVGQLFLVIVDADQLWRAILWLKQPDTRLWTTLADRPTTMYTRLYYKPPLYKFSNTNLVY